MCFCNLVRELAIENMSAFDRLLEQIDAFIRKYYKNELWKGLVFWTSFLLASWLLFSVVEYFGRFSSTIRAFLFYLFIGGNIYLATRYFVIPLLRLFEFGKRINREQAASIIGKFFPSVSDRLLNTLQLSNMINVNDRSYDLLAASVSQRSQELTVVPFVDAVRRDELKRYLKFGAPIVILFLAVLSIAPHWIIDGSSHVINYDKAQEAPYKYELVSSRKAVREGENIPVRVRITGLYVPEKCYVVSSRGKYLLKKVRSNELEFLFDNVKQDLVFHFESEGYKSDEYSVAVIGNSSLGSVHGTLIYPKYLKKKNEEISNVASVEVPEGTVIRWDILSKNTSEIKSIWKGKIRLFKGSELKWDDNYRESGDLRFILKNRFTGMIDSSSLGIEVIRDAYPTIVVVESTDSIKNTIRSFDGSISDDYGLTSLNFIYKIKRKSGEVLTRTIKVKPVSGVTDRFLFSVDFSRENLQIEDELTYYFRVSDNDGVNGSKSSNSSTFKYQVPTLLELNEKRDDKQKEIKKDLQDVLKRTEAFQKDVKALKKNMTEKSKSDFKSLEMLQNLQQEQQNLTEDLKEIQKEMEASNDEKEQLTEQDKEMLEQQQLIEELMKELMDDELMDLLKQLEEMMKKNDTPSMQKESEKIEQTTEDQKKQLDRTLEMLKRLQVNEKIDNLEEQLKELSKEQEELKSDIEKEKITKEEALKKQDEIEKKFEDVKKDMDEMEKLNEELKKPMDLGDFDEQKQSIDKDLKDSKESLQSGKESKAGKSQKSAADKMEEMAEQMNERQEKSNEQKQEEDMASIRLLLENLMALSFDQESNMDAFYRVKNNDPYYRRLGRNQRSLIDDTKIVEDSLLALAERQPKVAQFVDKELKEINSNFDLILDDIDNHTKWNLNQHQQLVMTSFNNLALLLNESLQNMQAQAQAQSKQKGSGSCSNPGGSGKPSPGSGEMSSEDMKQMLKKQLEQMKKGPNPGGKQPGDKPGNGNQGMPGLGNKEIAKMAAQQTAMRQQLEKLRNEMNKEGQGKGNQLNPLIKELEEQEKDLINKKFSPEMIKRQQDILTRLLESDKAIRERGFEEKRESNSAKNINPGNLIRFDEYNKQKLGQVELLKPVDPELTPYYKSKASQYFNLP